MRQAINENRTVQLALIGVLVLFGGFMLLKVTKGSGSEGAAAPPAADPASVAPPATGATAAAATPAAGGESAIPAGMVPGRGLPRGLLHAYRHGKAIVLLVRRAGGIDDRFVRASVNLLSRSDVGARVKIYVTKARHIARYTALTQGVDVSELPALVVVRPRALTHGVAKATVSYGFLGSASVLQAVRDALYRGPTKPYHP